MFARSLAIATSVALLSQFASAANKCVREYIVEAGDICDSISAANNVSTYQLAALNPGTINPACSNLQPGQALCIGSEGEDCASTHIVKSGDTCEGVYKAAQVNATILSLNNPQVNEDCTNIYVGEVLCVLNEVRVPPAPGVPIHTAPPASTTLVNENPSPTPTSTSTSDSSSTSTSTVTPTPTAEAEAEADAPPVETPAITLFPIAGAPAWTTPSAPKPTNVGTDGDDEEDCDEYEVVDGNTDEDLPFCDEVV